MLSLERLRMHNKAMRVLWEEYISTYAKKPYSLRSKVVLLQLKQRGDVFKNEQQLP